MSRDSGHDLFKNLNILTLPPQYIFPSYVSLLKALINTCLTKKYMEEILDNYKFSSTNIEYITVSKRDS
jgi:hypothetical protein